MFCGCVSSIMAKRHGRSFSRTRLKMASVYHIAASSLVKELRGEESSLQRRGSKGRACGFDGAPKYRLTLSTKCGTSLINWSLTLYSSCACGAPRSRGGAQNGKGTGQHAGDSRSVSKSSEGQTHQDHVKFRWSLEAKNLVELHEGDLEKSGKRL